MLIAIHYYAQAAEWLQCREENLQLPPSAGQATVRQVFLLLAKRHGAVFTDKICPPQADSLQKGVFVLLNGCHLARLAGLDTPVLDQDLLVVLPVIEAG